MKKETTFILSEYKIFYYVLNQQEEYRKHCSNSMKKIIICVILLIYKIASRNLPCTCYCGRFTVICTQI